MADRNATNSKAIWIKQAEEAKLKSEAEKAAAAKAAFEATFKDSNSKTRLLKQEAASDSDSEQDSEEEDLSNKPIGPVDPSKCTAAGAGIAGGTAGAASSFMVVTKDSDGRKLPNGGAEIRVKVAPGVGVGGSDQEGIVKDMNDGTYTVTYVVPKRGNYMLSIECNGKPIMGSPFPVFFSAGTSNGGLLGMAPSSNYPNLVNQTMPNMPNYSASVSGSFPGLLGMIPGVVSGASGGAILPGIGASLGEVCREYLNGRCSKTDCKLNHPPHNLLMTALAATTTMGTLSQVPMAPSAAAMAAAQAIVAAQALQAHAAQVQAQQSAKDSSGSPDKAGKDDALKRTLQVSNLSPLLTVEQLKQLFSFCGTVVECTITESKHFAYIEYSKPEEATAALALNNMDVGGRPMNVEMAKSLPQKSALLNSSLASSSLPMMMQQAVAMQQMQFQQALLMQQTLTAQQAANRAATMKSATELASARAAEISKKLKADGPGDEEKQTKDKSRSPSPSLARSRSKSRSPVTLRRTFRARSRTKSRSPISYHRRRRSRSYSPVARRPRGRRSRSPLRSRYHSSYDNERWASRDGSDRSRRRDLDRFHDHHSPVARRKKSRSVSPHNRKSYRSGSDSPKHFRESSPNRAKKSARAHSRSPRYHRRTSPRNNDVKLKYRNRARSKSVEELNEKMDVQDGKEKHRARKRSRSASVEGKYPGRGRSPRGSSDENRSKDRRHSRSKSAIGKRNPKEKVEGSRDNKLKHSHKRRSRSKSVEDNHQTEDKGDENKDRKSKHRYRRRSRSRSAEGKHSRRSRSPRGLSESKRKHKRRSRSKSLEGKHHSDDRIEERRDEKSKHHNRERSISAEGKCHRSRLSPASLKGSDSKCTRPSRSQSLEDRHHTNDGRGETRDDQSMHSYQSGEKIEDAIQEPDSAVKDFMIIEDDGLLISEHKNYDEKKSVENISVEHNHEELRKYEMPDTQHQELFRNSNASNLKKGLEDQDDCKRSSMAEQRVDSVSNVANLLLGETDSLSPKGFYFWLSFLKFGHFVFGYVLQVNVEEDIKDSSL
ncbi:hypothetical protein QYF36_009429 [Acer negundo]|nr:hypothetical protein QYF36_009429 [Acer negundo]